MIIPKIGKNCFGKNPLKSSLPLVTPLFFAPTSICTKYKVVHPPSKQMINNGYVCAAALSSNVIFKNKAQMAYIKTTTPISVFFICLSLKRSFNHSKVQTQYLYRTHIVHLLMLLLLSDPYSLSLHLLFRLLLDNQDLPWLDGRLLHRNQ